MRSLTFFLAFILVYICSVTAENHTISVGPELSFSPSNVLASPGDWVKFKFLRSNHSVVQSTFDNPCTKMEGGIDSGWQPTQSSDLNDPNVESLDIPINDSQSMWFFCAQTQGADHCRQGMVFAINPSTEQTFDEFQAKARNQNQNAGVFLQSDIASLLVIMSGLAVGLSL
ncbi:serine-threonine rich [Moniliophthora roreri MCA 2997]|uniref:Serine-threonine rich n=2 Tax=Moniliophthora roreri TaxID=221103 RepID=V2WWH5_MONRO|nr:serine-threonine rich [Moniliophthora roreri MCA 2997]KAI3616636.1 serine-threonine rich [Moniliophthora roreri]